MSNPRLTKPRVIPGLLDRLIDKDPDEKTENSIVHYHQIQSFMHSVKRDLENLLNTRLSLLDCSINPEKDDMLKKSLINYGMQDFSALHLEDIASRIAFCRQIQERISLFEPRIKNVQVQLLPRHDPFDRTLRLRIEGSLQIEAVTEAIILDSVIRPENTAFVLNEM